jgi:hypothetical protein
MNDNTPILPREILSLYSTMDLINLIATASEVLSQRKHNTNNE